MGMTKLSFKHLISVDQIKKEDINKILFSAEKYSQKVKNKVRSNSECSGYILATLFFEPSTRTRFSFESAMLRLGGQIITLEHGFFSSVKKGESLSDMSHVVSKYADLIVIRHPKMGSAMEFSKNSDVPVINGGDGANEHPTQSLADIYTIYEEKNRLDNLTIGVLGDLKYSRTVYSLLRLIALYPNNKIVLISHPLVNMQKDRKTKLEKMGCKIVETQSLEEVKKDLDILYVTRVQRERFTKESEFEEVKNKYCIDPKILEGTKKDLTIMHALPRVDEISVEVDKLPQAKYFDQAQNAVFVRMALLDLMKDG